MKKFEYFDYFLVIPIFTFVLLYFYPLDKGFLLENNYFPWDSHYYFEMALNFRDDLNINTFKYPINERVLFPFILACLSKYLSIEISYAALVLNLTSTFLTTYLILFVLNKFNIKFFNKIFIIFIFLTSFIMPLRFSIYYPGSNFAFDVLIVSSISLILFFQIKNNSKILFFVSLILSIIGTLERGILILMIYLLPLIALFFLNKLRTKNKLTTIQIKNFFIYTLLSFLSLILIKRFGYDSVKGYNMITEIISSIQFQGNIFEFFYKYYYSFGVFFLLITTYTILNFRKLLKLIVKIKDAKIEYIFIITIFVNSIIFSTIGGRGDVDRFLLWFLLPYLVLAGYILNQLQLNKKFNKIIILVFIIGLFGARIFAPAWPPLAFSTIFVEKNHVNTNFRDDLFFGPDFLKKFRNKMVSYNIGKDEYYKNIYSKYHKDLSQNVEIPGGQYFNYAKHRNYIHAYKYRINDIPFPLGYIHNQRNALIDHPYHGHRIIRFAYLLQWLLIQIVLIFYLKKFNVFRIFK